MSVWPHDTAILSLGVSVQGWQGEMGELPVPAPATLTPFLAEADAGATDTPRPEVPEPQPCQQPSEAPG